MSISSRYKDLFHIPATSDKLQLFESLFDTRELDVDLTLALLKVIHKELCIHQTPDRSLYKRYAEMIETLRYHKSDMLHQVVDAWKAENSGEDTEWLTEGVIK